MLEENHCDVQLREEAEVTVKGLSKAGVTNDAYDA